LPPKPCLHCPSCRDYAGISSVKKLKLPSVATWWCGQQEARRLCVLDHLEALEVRPAFPRAASKESKTESASGSCRAVSAADNRFSFQPQLFVAQGTRPVYQPHPLLDWRRRSPLGPVSVRVYLVATSFPKAIRAMPGGLTRIGAEPGPDGVVLSLQQGGATKDTWVLSDGPVEDLTLLSASSQNRRTCAASAINLPSRAWRIISFWLGRYSERGRRGPLVSCEVCFAAL